MTRTQAVREGLPGAFLDRDDTLIRRTGGLPTGDLGEPGEVELMPGAAEACVRLREAGYVLVVITNQGGVARGSYGEEAVEAVHRRLDGLLIEAGLPASRVTVTDGAATAGVDLYRYCPFHPRGVVEGYVREHPWRKPGPGMILDAAGVLGLDLSRSLVVGDAARDVEAGVAAGVPGARCVRSEREGVGVLGAVEGLLGMSSRGRSG